MGFLKNTKIVALISVLYLMSVSAMLSAQSLSYVENRVIYNFETLEEWQPISNASKFMLFGERTNANGVVVNYPSMQLYSSVPTGMGSLVSQSTNSLGIKVSFLRRGYNFFDLIPTEQKVIPGKVDTIDVWVWGANYNYSMEVLVSDFKGYTHTLSLGSLKYRGWGNLSVAVPKSISRGDTYGPNTPGLRFLNFRFWSSPAESADNFSVFLDYCRAVTDVFKGGYDGADLEGVLADEAGEPTGDEDDVQSEGATTNEEPTAAE